MIESICISRSGHARASPRSFRQDSRARRGRAKSERHTSRDCSEIGRGRSHCGCPGSDLGTNVATRKFWSRYQKTNLAGELRVLVIMSSPSDLYRPVIFSITCASQKFTERVKDITDSLDHAKTLRKQMFEDLDADHNTDLYHPGAWTDYYCKKRQKFFNWWTCCQEIGAGVKDAPGCRNRRPRNLTLGKF